jgi:peptide/nickel transport system substrate-binding protein
MKAYSRREFLRLAALGAATTAISACSVPATQVPSATEFVPAATASPPTPTPAPAVPTVATASARLNYAELGSFDNFNPWRATAVNSAMYNQVFSRLVYEDSDGNLQGDIAESWELSQDALKLTLKLHENVKWHDGQECNADNIVADYAYTQDASIAEDLSITKQVGLLEPISDVKAIDKYTVELTFKVPTAYFTEILDYWYIIRIDDKQDLNFMKKLPIGTGPFKIVEWKPKQYSSYSKYTEYHVQDLPYLDEWRFVRLDKAETLLPNLQSKEVDGATSLPYAALHVIGSDPDFQSIKSDSRVINMIVNTHLPPFDKKEVRQALSYSMNRQAMAQAETFGFATPTCTPWSYPESLAYREDLVMAYPFDLDKAANLLEQAGVTGLETTVHVTPAIPEKAAMLVWQADLAKIGVTLKVEEVEIARFLEIGQDPNLQGFGLQPWRNGRVLRDPAIFMSTQGNYRGGKDNWTGWVNDELENLVQVGASEVDTEKRRAAYQRINEILVEEQPMICMYTDPAVWVFNKDVQGATVDLIPYLMLAQATVSRSA